MSNILENMTGEEVASKADLVSLLRSEGADLFADFLEAIHFQWMTETESASLIPAYMIPEQRTIRLNRFVNPIYYSLLLRHEIMHFALQHAKRLTDQVAREMGYDPSKLDNLTLKELQSFAFGLYNQEDGHPLGNEFGDFELATRAYSDEDKDLSAGNEAKGIPPLTIQSQVLGGLVTERYKDGKYANWYNENWTLEQMIHFYIDTVKNKYPEAYNFYGDLEDEQTFVSETGDKYGI